MLAAVVWYEKAIYIASKATDKIYPKIRQTRRFKKIVKQNLLIIFIFYTPEL